MFTDAVTLIDQTIDNLETLAAVFADDFDERVQQVTSVSPDAALCRTAYLKIGALLPALRAARAMHESQASGYRTHCLHCD